MDRDAATQKMKDLKARARKAKKEGKTAAAKGFRAGAKRLQRRLAASAPKPQGKRKNAS